VIRSARPSGGGEDEWHLPIGLIALDIDGTLVGPDLVLGDRTRRAIRAAMRQGVSVSLVTGRMATSARRFAEVLRLRDPIVAYQGGLIRAMPEPGSLSIGRLLVHRPLPALVAREAIRWSQDVGFDPHINHLEHFILRADDPRADDYSTFLGARARLVPDIALAATRPVTKVLAVSEEPLPWEVLAAARERFQGRADVTISHPRFLEFVAPGVSKGAALRWLARRRRIPLARTLAIGDQYNDLEMVATAGHGAAMPSAPARVRLAGRYIAPPLAEEGVAQMIESLVLASPARAARNARRMAEEAAAARAGIEREIGAETLHDPGAVPGPATLTGATEAASLGTPAVDPDDTDDERGEDPRGRSSHVGP
jgi:Cof subfamily protein (haloacid dehalogenase superfamily)